jgi:hypothetical protein
MVLAGSLTMYRGQCLFLTGVLCLSILLSVFLWYVMSGVSSCHRTVLSSQLVILEAASRNLAFSHYVQSSRSPICTPNNSKAPFLGEEIPLTNPLAFPQPCTLGGLRE